jgi:hypothetical protein
VNFCCRTRRRCGCDRGDGVHNQAVTYHHQAALGRTCSKGIFDGLAIGYARTRCWGRGVYQPGRIGAAGKTGPAGTGRRTGAARAG